MSRRAELAVAFLEACRARGTLVATAESCTGGLIIATDRNAWDLLRREIFTL